MKKRFASTSRRGGKPDKVILSRVAVNLDETAPGTSPERVWVQVASEGIFKGYAGGTIEFTLDARIFEQIIGNFRRHPSYQAASDGYGMSNVIPWDFHHASEMPATEGTVPSMGAPAQGWIQELSLRMNGEGKAELWALTKWLEPARSYIKEGRYQWASVSVVFDAVDARTGDVIGPLLTSVALTNQPFIEGMQQLAASKFAAEKWRNDMYVEAAGSAEHAFEMIRKLLGLPDTADISVVAGELEKVKQWALNGTAPVGVEIGEIVSDIRTIFNLPSLSSTEEVFVEMDKLTARLIEESGVSTGAPAGSPPPPAMPAPSVTPEGTPPPPPDMTPASTLERREMELLKVLAEKFGVVAKAEDVVAVADQLLELRGAIVQNIGLEANASHKIVLKATLDDSGVRAKYGAILGALGIEDPDAALDKIADLMGESAKLAEMAPEFAVLKQRQLEAEEEVMDEEVEAAVASAGVAASSTHFEGLKLALSVLRKNDPAKFAEKYPKAMLDKGRQALSRPGIDPTKLTSRITASNTGTGGPDAPPAGGVTPSGGQIDVSGYTGANKILRTCEFVKCTMDGAKSWPWNKVHEQASKLVRSGVVTG